jgi:hypothetical protein
MSSINREKQSVEETSIQKFISHSEISGDILIFCGRFEVFFSASDFFPEVDIGQEFFAGS